MASPTEGVTPRPLGVPSPAAEPTSIREAGRVWSEERNVQEDVQRIKDRIKEIRSGGGRSLSEVMNETGKLVRDIVTSSASKRDLRLISPEKDKKKGVKTDTILERHAHLLEIIKKEPKSPTDKTTLLKELGNLQLELETEVALPSELRKTVLPGAQREWTIDDRKRALFTMGKHYEAQGNAEKAAEMFVRSADEGYDEAQFKLGEMRQAENDREGAVSFYRQAAEQGHIRAQIKLGDIYHEQANRESHPQMKAQKQKMSTDAYEQAASQITKPEHRDALFNLALMQTKGDYTPGNLKTFFARYSPDLLFEIAQHFEKNHDIESAIKWLQRGANLGDPDAQFQLAKLRERSPSVAVHADARATLLELYHKSAGQGHTGALMKLAEWSEVDPSPTAQTTAIAHYRKAAEQGNPIAQLKLGLKYLRGEGITQNTENAVMWLRRAAAQGKEVASETLRNLYNDHIHFKFDDLALRLQNAIEQHQNLQPILEEISTHAVQLSSLAGGERPSGPANFILGLLHENNLSLSGEVAFVPNRSQANEYYQKAGEVNYAPALYKGGLIFERKKDREEALYYLNRSGDQGYGIASYHSAELHYEKAKQILDSAPNPADVRSTTVPHESYFIGLQEQSRLEKQEGLERLKQAAAHGYRPAQIELAKYLIKKNTPISNQAELTQAAQLLEEAANGGDGYAAFKLAAMYENGIGVKKDLEKARLFAQQALEKNYTYRTVDDNLHLER